ncbi:MAG: metallophosphoesterase [Bacteroidota bacterium]
MFILFLSIFLLAYSIINYYIFIRGWQALDLYPAIRIVYAVLFFVLYASFISGRFLERMSITHLSTSMVWIGSFWLAAMVYFLFFVLMIDLVRFFWHITHITPTFIYAHYELIKLILISAATATIGVAMVAGHLNAISPRLKNLEITIPKAGGTLKNLNIAVASDIHLGTIVSQGRLEHIIDIINGLQPDLILLPGDVIDEDLGPVIKMNLGETLRKFKAKFGVFAVTGNHEYIGGVEPACKYLTEHGITMLRDKVVLIENSLYLAGREDISIRQFARGKRMELKELVAGIDTTLPVILMDHQPFHLEDAMNNKIDLQLSGHTHHGQMWPFNYITEKVYELSWGFLRKGNTQYYVSCGVGTWGPPVRIGNTPEILNIRLKIGN